MVLALVRAFLLRGLISVLPDMFTFLPCGNLSLSLVLHSAYYHIVRKSSPCFISSSVIKFHLGSVIPSYPLIYLSFPC